MTKKKNLKGQVIFYKPDYVTKTLTEIGRTKTLPFAQALMLYAETPNPASQIISFETEGERRIAEARLQQNIVDREWLDDLFEQI